MYKSYLRIRRAFCTLPATLALLLAGAWLPAARADIFVSNGSGGQVLSYSEFTGAFHLYYLVNPGLHAFTTGVAVGPDVNLYVADLNNLEVVQFTPGNSFSTGVSISLSPPAAPMGITFGPGGSLYVADNLGYIRRFSGPPSFTPTGKFSCSSTSGSPCYPFDLTFGPDGNLYVSDFASRGVVQLNGSTLEWMSEFVPSFNPNAFPAGLHFDNGNLYVVFEMPQTNDNISSYYNDIFEFNGSSGGAPIASFQVPYSYTAQSDFGIGPGSSLLVAGNPSFTEYSPSTGSVLGTFGNPGVPPYEAGFVTIGACSICTVGPPSQLYAPIGLDSSQTLRLSVIEGPVWVPPGVPVQVQLGFQNSQGAPVGPNKVATLNPGQTASLDLVASTLISSGRIEIQPVVTAVPGAPSPMGSLNGSAEVYTAANGFGSIFYPGNPVPAMSNLTGPPSFLPQGVALGQSIQINAAAPPDSPCVAMLSFTDDNGNPIGPTQQVNLSPGQMASLTFNPNKYTKSGRQEYVPQITPNNPTGGQGVAPACLGSAEVYITKTGSTSTYQTSSPAVGTMPLAP